MSQIEKLFDDFKFFGCFPIDFSKISYFSINDIDFHYLYTNKKNKIGFVFNLDKHNEPGSHWVSLFINLHKKEIMYYDSVGNKCPTEINVFIKKCLKNICQLFNHKYNISIYYNDVIHQKKDSECGVYVINFIMRMIEDINFNKFINEIDKLEDDNIETLRYWIFIPD